jgi:hypothetical protein
LRQGVSPRPSQRATAALALSAATSFLRRGGKNRCPLGCRFKPLGYRGRPSPRLRGLRRLKGRLGGFERQRDLVPPLPRGGRGRRVGRARRERPPGPAREGLEGKTATGTGTITTITPTKMEKPRGPGAASGRAPRKPSGHVRLQSAPAGAAPRDPRYDAGGSPARYISKEALYASGAVLRRTRALAGKAEKRRAFNSLQTNSRASRVRSSSEKSAAHPTWGRGRAPHDRAEGWFSRAGGPGGRGGARQGTATA